MLQPAIYACACLLLAQTLTVTSANQQVQTKRHQDTLIQHLLQRRNETPVMEFSENDFVYIVNNPYRHYSLFILFLSRQKTGEEICDHYAYEFSLVAHSFIERYSDCTDVFFAVVDLDLFPNAGPADVHSYQTPPMAFIPVVSDDAVVATSKSPWSAEDIARWVGRMLRRKVYVQRPGASWVALVMKVMLVATCMFIHRDVVVPFLKSGHKMAVAAMIFCFVMSSGQMFNLIEGASTFGDGNGFAGLLMTVGDSQTVVETIIVMVIYAGISLSFIAITDFTVGTGCRVYCNVVTSVAVGMIFLFFSVLLWMVRNKIDGYHLGLLF